MKLIEALCTAQKPHYALLEKRAEIRLVTSDFQVFVYALNRVFQMNRCVNS